MDLRALSYDQAQRHYLNGVISADVWDAWQYCWRNSVTRISGVASQFEDKNAECGACAHLGVGCTECPSYLNWLARIEAAIERERANESAS